MEVSIDRLATPLEPRSRPKEPQEIMCPITHVMFRDPVIVPEAGRTYERHALESFWRTSGRQVDPLSNVPLQRRELFTNWDKRGEVQAWLEQHPELIPAGWDDRSVPPPLALEASALEEGGGGGKSLASGSAAAQALALWSSATFSWLRCLRRLVMSLVVTVLMCEAFVMLWAHRRLV
eukprot:TRINITY_DN115322_c0_g1_i1.p1 TRINITY_DN115322_c0_g1~~TRINITY_DN115322_c0_g1_i1.p1  ORF type:complete len:178 (-),score=36.45 TRINITY_DN115322_c0_g1_i1:40-573(-)